VEAYLSWEDSAPAPVNPLQETSLSLASAMSCSTIVPCTSIIGSLISAVWSGTWEPKLKPRFPLSFKGYGGMDLKKSIALTLLSFAYVSADPFYNFGPM